MFMTIILGYVTGFLLLSPLEHEPFNDDDDHLFQFNWYNDIYAYKIWLKLAKNDILAKNAL